MSLPILIAFVVVGITVGVLAVHLTGGSKRSAIADSDHAARLFAADFPKERLGRAFLTSDNQSAFIEMSENRVGIVQSFGDGFFARIVTASDVASVRLRDPAILSIRFQDFTWTGGHFHFAERPVAEAFAARLDRGGADSGAGA